MPPLAHSFRLRSMARLAMQEERGRVGFQTGHPLVGPVRQGAADLAFLGMAPIGGLVGVGSARLHRQATAHR